jgi:hypothetical protein
MWGPLSVRNLCSARLLWVSVLHSFALFTLCILFACYTFLSPFQSHILPLPFVLSNSHVYLSARSSLITRSLAARTFVVLISSLPLLLRLARWVLRSHECMFSHHAIPQYYSSYMHVFTLRYPAILLLIYAMHVFTLHYPTILHLLDTLGSCASCHTSSRMPCKRLLLRTL